MNPTPSTHHHQKKVCMAIYQNSNGLQWWIRLLFKKTLSLSISLGVYFSVALLLGVAM